MDKKIEEIQLNKDRKPHETLKKFFGEEWINQEIGKVKLDGYHNMNPMNLARLDVHPVIKAIVSTQIKLTESERKGKIAIPIGKAEALQSLLHKNLTILEPYLDITDLQRRLRDKKEFPKVEYELAVAAGYLRIDNEIKFIQPSSKKRTGEFYISDNSGNVILIECKKKDMISPKEKWISSWWEEFQHLMMQKLKIIKKSYGVTVYIPFKAERVETHQVAKEVEELIKSDQEGEFWKLKNKYKVILKRLSFLEETEKFSNDSHFGVTRILGDKKTGKISELMKITAYSPSDFIDEKVNSVISTLSTAYGQLEEDKPNIVYIDINIASMTPGRSQTIMEKLPASIEQKLARDYSKVSAIVLTNLKLLGHSGIYGFHADEVTVYNTKAKNPIPSSFKIYGDRKRGQSILEDIKNLL
ncbi:MAG: hypothetical protein ACKKMV_00370 [Candidatus Nealsonbacteria bacterium]